MAVDLTTVNSAVVIQAHVRGFLVRRKLLEVRKEFEEVVEELERDAMVCWKREGIRMPFITSDPKVIKSEKKKINALNREHGHKITRNQALLKEGFGIDAYADGEMLSFTVQNVNSSETEEHSLGNRNLMVSELHRDQIDEQRSTGCEGAMLEKSSHSERYDDGFLQNQEFVPENGMKPLQGLIQKEERTCPAEQSSEKLESVDLNAEIGQCTDDPCPHKRTVSSGFVFPLSSTLNPASFDEQGMKEKAVYTSTSEALSKGYVHKRPYLRDQVLLSDSWMSDRSFDPVEVDKIAVTDLPSVTVKLCELRDHIGMELLWTEQAIQSRKKYLGLRKGSSPAEPDCDSTWD